jgi:hypothetical protein
LIYKRYTPRSRQINDLEIDAEKHVIRVREPGGVQQEVSLKKSVQDEPIDSQQCALARRVIEDAFNALKVAPGHQCFLTYRSSLRLGQRRLPMGADIASMSHRQTP